MDRKQRVTVRSAGRWAVGVVAWTLVTWGIWLISLSAVSSEDLLVGGLCALACGVVAEAVRRAVEGRWRLSADLLTGVAAVPVAVVLDTLSVLAAPIRPGRREATVRRIHIGAQGESDRARGRRAIATALTSMSPGTVVLDADPEDGSLVVHSLAPAGPSVAERFARPHPATSRSGDER